MKMILYPPSLNILVMTGDIPLQTFKRHETDCQ